MTQLIKILTSKPDNLSLRVSIHMTEANSLFLQKVFWPLCLLLYHVFPLTAVILCVNKRNKKESFNRQKLSQIIKPILVLTLMLMLMSLIFQLRDKKRLFVLNTKAQQFLSPREENSPGRVLRLKAKGWDQGN